MGDAFRVNFYRPNIKTGIENTETTKTGTEMVEDELLAMGMSKNGVRYVMNKLKNRGILVRVGSAKRGKWYLRKKVSHSSKG